MNEYLLCIIGTVLFSAFVVAILPEGKMSGTIKGVAKMVCLLTIIAPIPQYLQKQGKTQEYQITQEFFSATVIQSDVHFIQYYSEMRIADAERALQDEIRQVFSCDTEISIEIEPITAQTYLSDIKIQCLRVCFLTEEMGEKQQEIQDYLTERYGCGVVFE